MATTDAVISRTETLNKYLKLDQRGSIIAEYVWIDSEGGTRAKARVSTLSSRLQPTGFAGRRGYKPRRHHRGVGCPATALSSSRTTGVCSAATTNWRISADNARNRHSKTRAAPSTRSQNSPPGTLTGHQPDRRRVRTRMFTSSPSLSSTTPSVAPPTSSSSPSASTPMAHPTSSTTGTSAPS
jgi:hypothetical protein